MAHGGKRSGSGRKMTEARKAQLAAAQEAAARCKLSDGETPLDYMLRVMRDTTADTKRRDNMALGAASYLHPRLAAVEHSGQMGVTLTQEAALNEIEQATEEIDAANGQSH